MGVRLVVLGLELAAIMVASYVAGYAIGMKIADVLHNAE